MHLRGDVVAALSIAPGFASAGMLPKGTQRDRIGA